MDIQPFKITFWDTMVAAEPSEEDMSGALEGLEGLNLAYELFYDAYGHFTPNYWTIRLGETEFKFDINDIFFIWEELPDVVAASMNPSDQLTYDSGFYFAEQWTELCLIITARDETSIFVSPLSTNDYDEEVRAEKRGEITHNERVQRHRIPISKQNFVAEWRGFAEHLVQLFIEHGYIAADDPAIAEYFGRMPVL